MSGSEADRPLLRTLAPFIFLGLWSNGFAMAKLGLTHAEPLTFLAWRYLLALWLLIALALVFRPRLPRGQGLWVSALVGLLIQAGYFSCSYLSFRYGLGVGMAALILALQPILVGLLSPMLTGQRVDARLWLGLGLGLLGATVVIVAQSGVEILAVSPVAMASNWGLALLFGVLALLFMTSAALVEARLGRPVHPISSNMVQYAVGLLVVLILARTLERGIIAFNTESMLALAYLVIGNSLISISVLLYMIRVGEVARVSALLYLVPPLAALAAWMILGERMQPLAWVGMVIALGGVLLARRRGRAGSPAKVPPASVQRTGG